MSACDGGALAVGDAVELQNLNAAPALNGMTGVITAIDGGITKVKMDDGGSMRNVPSVKVKASGCPAHPLDKTPWPKDTICYEGSGGWWPQMTRSGQCSGWCGVGTDAQGPCFHDTSDNIMGAVVREYVEVCCADYPCQLPPRQCKYD